MKCSCLIVIYSYKEFLSDKIKLFLTDRMCLQCRLANANGTTRPLEARHTSTGAIPTIHPNILAPDLAFTVYLSIAGGSAEEAERRSQLSFHVRSTF